MNRWLLSFAVVTVGCVATLPPGDTGITADLATETARMVIQMRRDIHPTPAPVPSDQCENCNGTGKIGDSVHVVRECPVCRGTGKKTAACVSGTCGVKR